MKLFTRPQQKRFVQQLSALVYTNPFLPERLRLEREILGSDHVDSGEVWSVRTDERQERPNVVAIQQRMESLVAELRPRLAAMRTVDPEDARLYADLVQYTLYYRTWQHFDPLAASESPPRRIKGWPAFAEAYRHFLSCGPLQPAHRAEESFALCFQVRRAFYHIFTHIVGGSLPVARLRAAVWQSIFTHDLAAYRDSLHARMGDIPTLVLGPSGTGKELVARAIALSRYIPFDPTSQRFVEDTTALFVPLNLSALAPTLIESELFGHRRGAFTGALEDRAGWLEQCGERGTVFLDEIGELDPQIQVKLLRVLQSRTFQRLGEATTRRFAGKIIAATNRNLAEEMSARRFRQDLYYRLCADVITTPTLADQLSKSASPEEELRRLVGFIAIRVAGPERAEVLARSVVDHVRDHVGIDYPWPGNFRELEQCVRNVLIRGEYRPAFAAAPVPTDDAAALAIDLRAGNLSAEDLLARYCRIVYDQLGSYDAAARRVGLDRRTVKAHILRTRTAE